MQHISIVIAGHVDHGKSTLIGRLLADTDSLPDGRLEEIKKTCDELGREFEYSFIMDNLREEREQNITIDTAQIFFQTKKRRYVIIDAPGHVEFIKNMITGASQAQAAVLIVDADEGVQEQTRRHAYILSLLGIGQVIVVLNKMDKVEWRSERFNTVCNELRTFLKEIKIKPLNLIPISAKNGDNIAKKSKAAGWYDGPTLLEALDDIKLAESIDKKPLRYPIQDVYIVGDKRIFVGRVESGKIEVDEEVTVLPNPRKTKIKSIEVYGKDTKDAKSGESIGVTTRDKLFIERGNVICSGRAPNVSDSFKAKVFWMDKKPLKEGEKLTLKLATQEVGCTLTIERRIDSSTLDTLTPSELANNEVAEATIKTDQPTVVENFNDIPELGRFTLTRDQDTVAGGIIV